MELLKFSLPVHHNYYEDLKTEGAQNSQPVLMTAIYTLNRANLFNTVHNDFPSYEVLCCNHFKQAYLCNYL